MKIRQSILATLALAALTVLVADAALAQTPAPAPAIKRTLLQRIDVGDNREAILGLAEIAPGGAAGRHTHPGVEFGYVVEGSASLEVEGETPKLLKAATAIPSPWARSTTPRPSATSRSRCSRPTSSKRASPSPLPRHDVPLSVGRESGRGFSINSR